MAWTNLTYSVGEVLTSAKMTQMFDNFQAMADGDAGAPAMQNAAITSDTLTTNAIAANAVTTSELKTTLADQSQDIPPDTSFADSNFYFISLTGGQYTMGWFLGFNTTSEDQLNWYCNSEQYASTHGIRRRFGSSTETLTVRSRYIQGSPPYDLGNGQVPLFVFVLQDKRSGDVVGTYVAQDPPWYAHGPHRFDAPGKIARYLDLWDVEEGEVFAGRDLNLSPREYLQALSKAKTLSKQELTSALKYQWTTREKNIDMDTVPHLFTNYNPAIHNVLLLDPVSNFMDKLRLLHLMEPTGEDTISALLKNGYIKLGDTIKGAYTPRGVLPVYADFTL